RPVRADRDRARAIPLRLSCCSGRKPVIVAVTYLEAIREAMAEEMARDERVFLIGEDIGRFGGAFKVTDGLLDRFGSDRIVETPISESAIIGAAVGAAYMGLRPVAELQ